MKDEKKNRKKRVRQFTKADFRKMIQQNQEDLEKLRLGLKVNSKD